MRNASTMESRLRRAPKGGGRQDKRLGIAIFVSACSTVTSMASHHFFEMPLVAVPTHRDCALTHNRLVVRPSFLAARWSGIPLPGWFRSIAAGATCPALPLVAGACSVLETLLTMPALQHMCERSNSDENPESLDFIGLRQ
jgi:hypothetical protein